MLVRASTKSYTQVFAELITHVRKSGRQSAGDVIENHLARQPGTNWYWPDSGEVRAELQTLAAYRRLSLLNPVRGLARRLRDQRERLAVLARRPQEQAIPQRHLARLHRPARR